MFTFIWLLVNLYLLLNIDNLKLKKMDLKVKKGIATTSIYDGKLEICQFVSGSSSVNKKYADLFAKTNAMKLALEEIVYGIEIGLGNKHQLDVAKKALNELA